VADAARRTPELAAVRALVLAALADGRAGLEELSAERDDGESRGRAHLTTAVRDAGRGARSAPEAEAADALLALPDGVLPPFVLNPRLVLEGRLLGVPDGYLPGTGLGWEVDSVRHHGSSRDLAATLDRHARFADAGVELLHVVPAVLRREPAAWARQVAARAAHRRASGRGDPDGLEVVLTGPLLR
ncbi:MAG TPA: hypothetical protein VNU66_05840, partial [Mycobacteriales bacterium]|nr:hypothetical protein [Mycobacteriales bacterium]